MKKVPLATKSLYLSSFAFFASALMETFYRHFSVDFSNFGD